MTIGGSIGLIVLGAILYFAVTAELAGVDIQVVGLILMIGGAIGIVIGLILRQRTARATPVIDQDPDAF